MKTQPLIFRGSDEPVDADYWISAIEDKLGLFENTDEEKVTFAAHQLQDAAGVWWRSYKALVGARNRITWDKFRKAFRDHDIPNSVLKLKRDEFRKLKQGNMATSWYKNTLMLSTIFLNILLMMLMRMRRNKMTIWRAYP
jgi:hypothetical protein